VNALLEDAPADITEGRVLPRPIVRAQESPDSATLRHEEEQAINVGLRQLPWEQRKVHRTLPGGCDGDCTSAAGPRRGLCRRRWRTSAIWLGYRVLQGIER
jgi:hypothetical protein